MQLFQNTKALKFQLCLRLMKKSMFIQVSSNFNFLMYYNNLIN